MRPENEDRPDGIVAGGGWRDKGSKPPSRLLIALAVFAGLLGMMELSLSKPGDSWGYSLALFAVSALLWMVHKRLADSARREGPDSPDSTLR